MVLAETVEAMHLSSTSPTKLTELEVLTGPEKLARDLEQAWGSWSPNMTPDAHRVAFISDRDGIGQLWVQDVGVHGGTAAARKIWLSDDPVISVQWSADRAWLSCAVATDGGVRTQVWVVRPDGTDARQVAGSRDVHAELGPWARSGHRLVVTIPSAELHQPAYSYLVNPVDGERQLMAEGELIHVLDLSIEERFVILLDGKRGEQFCVVLDRMADEVMDLLPERGRGSTEMAMIRPAPPQELGPLMVYLVTDMGAARRQLVSIPIGPNGWRGPERVVASRDDAELEAVDADDEGRLLALTWNVAGISEIELLDVHTDTRRTVPDVPGMVAEGLVLSRDGSCVIVCIEGPASPRRLWHLATDSLEWHPVTELPELPDVELVTPTLQTYQGRDGLELTGWLYKSDQAQAGSAGPAMLYLHGGPEGQERPIFSPQHQAMAAGGITVFAPNIRGSSGFGRAFVHADDVHRRFDAFDDVLATADHLVDLGVADPDRIAVTGRSYGGYLTLVMLAFHPEVFAAGVDVCGMSDMFTFYRDTEPWIASAAMSKYGDPEVHADLLERISPLGRAADIVSPLLVVHGEFDTNVPIGEAHQIVEALRSRHHDVQYLELAAEGHVYRRIESRQLLNITMLRFLERTLSQRAP